MTFTDWHVPTPSPNFNRARVAGFVGCVGCNNMSIVGQALEWYYDGTRYFAHLEIADHFWVPSSNTYSLDYVFNRAGSYLKRDGVVIDAIFWLALPFVVELQQTRIHVFADLPYDPDVNAPLTPLAGYWNPIYPP